MKKETKSKLENMKGRKSVFHYDEDGNVRYISVEESDEPFFSGKTGEALLNVPAFLRRQAD